MERHTGTVAERIASIYENDGQLWWRGHDRNIIDVCKRFSAHWRYYDHGATDSIRFEFRDGSALVVVNGYGWDLGFPGVRCDCWASCGHDPECVAACSAGG